MQNLNAQIVQKMSDFGNSADSIAITFLTPAYGQSARKVHRLRETAAGTTLETTDYDKAARFRHCSEPIEDIESLLDALQRLSQRNGFVIRGQVRPDAPAVIYRRVKKGDNPDIQDVPSRVVAVDLDTEEAPDWLDTDDITAVGDYLRSRLPTELQGVSCVVQLSAGYGLWRWKAGPCWLKARLWFVAKEPLDGAQLRRWFNEQNATGQWATMDASVAGCQQPIYTATPEFQGLTDPVWQRWTLLLGETDVAAIRAPAALERPQPGAVAVGSAPRNPRVLGVCVRMIEAAQDGEKHTVLNRASYLAGGYVAAGSCTLEEARTALQEAISRKSGVADLQAAFATIDQAVQDGQRAPLATLPDWEPEPEPEPEPEDVQPADATHPDDDPDDAPLNLSGGYREDLAALETARPKKGRKKNEGGRRFVLRHFWRCPWKIHCAELIADITEALALNQPQQRKLQKTVAWLESEARKRAVEPTVLDKAALRTAGVEVVEVASIADALAAVQARPDALNLVKAGLGTGKTERVLKPLADATRGTAVIVSNRVSLIDDLCKRLGMDNYRNMRPADIAASSKLAICLPSITNPKYGDPLYRTRLEGGALLIDEISGAVREAHSTSGVLKGGAKNVWLRLTDLLRRAPVACGVDADLSTADVLALQGETNQRPVRVIEVKPAPVPLSVQIGESAQVWQGILSAAAWGVPFCVVSDSAQQIQKLKAHLSVLYPDRNFCAIHSAPGVGTTGEADVQAVLKDINAAAPQLHGLLYSPCVESGVSLTTPHFKRHFGLYCGQIPPAAFLQMMRRDRTAACFEVGIIGCGARWNLENDAGAVLANMEATHRRTEQLTADECGYVIRHIPKTPWDGRVCEYSARANRARGNYSQNLWLYLEAQGAQVSRLEGKRVDPDTLTEAGDLARSDYRTAVQEAPDISEEAREQIRQTYQPSQAQNAAAERYDAKATMAVAELDVLMLDAWNEGKTRPKVRNFMALQAPLRGFADDMNDHIANVSLAERRNRIAIADAIRTAFEVCGFDPATGGGEIDQDTALEAWLNLKASPVRPVLEHAGLMKFGKQPPRYPVRWVGDFLDKLGLAFDGPRKQGKRGLQARVYRIGQAPDCDSRGGMTNPGWRLMAGIAERREKQRQGGAAPVARCTINILENSRSGYAGTADDVIATLEAGGKILIDGLFVSAREVI